MNKIDYCYIKRAGGVATVAYKNLEKVKPSYEAREGTFIIQYATAFCSPNDQFRKSTGRTLAVERLQTDTDSKNCILVDDQANKGKFVQIAQALELIVIDDMDTAPSWWR